MQTDWQCCMGEEVGQGPQAEDPKDEHVFYLHVRRIAFEHADTFNQKIAFHLSTDGTLAARQVGRGLQGMKEGPTAMFGSFRATLKRASS